MVKSKGIKYDNCKDCNSRCAHAGKNRRFVCPKGVSCKVKKEDPQTNADRIRAMSDEELAWELMTWRIETVAKCRGDESNYPSTQATILEWLKQPAEVVDERKNSCR